MLPPGLGPSGGPGGPEDREDGHTEREFMPRPITMEEAVGRQLDRIAYLRSMGFPWEEAVMVLRDMVQGLEDREFRNGVPDAVWQKMQSLSVEKRKEIMKDHSHMGWETMPVRSFRTTRGRTVYRPTPEQLSLMLRCIMSLLQRKGITWRQKNVSYLDG